MALAVGAVVPWVILQIIARPGMPVSVVYLFIWQWLQVFTRVLQSIVDNESMANGLYGPNVARAYWYMLAGLVVMALAIRMVLGNLKPPTAKDRTAHFEWRPIDLFSLYIGMLFLAVGCRFASVDRAGSRPAARCGVAPEDRPALHVVHHRHDDGAQHQSAVGRGRARDRPGLHRPACRTSVACSSIWRWRLWRRACRSRERPWRLALPARGS